MKIMTLRASPCPASAPRAGRSEPKSSPRGTFAGRNAPVDRAHERHRTAPSNCVRSLTSPGDRERPRRRELASRGRVCPPHVPGGPVTGCTSRVLMGSQRHCSPGVCAGELDPLGSFPSWWCWLGSRHSLRAREPGGTTAVSRGNRRDWPGRYDCSHRAAR